MRWHGLVREGGNVNKVEMVDIIIEERIENGDLLGDIRVKGGEGARNLGNLSGKLGQECLLAGHIGVRLARVTGTSRLLVGGGTAALLLAQLLR